MSLHIGDRKETINGCARCQNGHGHKLFFRELRSPVCVEDQIIATHWALCPTTNEPILMNVIADVTYRPDSLH